MMTRWILPAAALSLCACGGDEVPADDELERAALLGVKSYVSGQLDLLAAAATAMRAAAPAPDADGWSPATDAVAITAMKAEWKKARNAYERVEGAIAVLFPNLDVATDERYDGFLEEGPDDNLFDDQGVIGVHAVERILWADSHPPEVIAFESALAGSSTAAFPSTMAEADDFKNKLLARLETDTARMRDDFAPLALDTATAYRGVIGSMEEQLEKVSLASTGESESRYANYTLSDMRANLEGGVAIFDQFHDWLLIKEGGPAIHDQIESALSGLDTEYTKHAGDGIPPVPATWNPDQPSAADLATDYGKLWSLLTTECDPAVPTSLVSKMTSGGDLLGIPALPE